MSAMLESNRDYSTGDVLCTMECFVKGGISPQHVVRNRYIYRDAYDENKVKV